jgi:uncharacterized RDD family membrane protein YckC
MRIIMLSLVFAMFAFKAEAAAAVFELRTYTATPGKMADLHARFRDHTLALFKKHGIAVVGFWVPSEKPETLVYLLSFPDKAAADAAWKTFRADPEWIKARADSEKKAGGSLTARVESVYMAPADYSPLK